MMRSETIDRAASEAKRMSEDAWRGVTKKTSEAVQEVEIWPQLVVAGILSGASAVGVFSAYHGELGRAMPETAMIGGLVGTGAAATYVAQMAAKADVQMHWTFLGISATLGGVYAVMNKYLYEAKKKPHGAPVVETMLPPGAILTTSSVAPQALVGLSVGIATAAVAAAYWK
jgi:hypothetical protein